MRLLSAADVRVAFPMDQAVIAMKRALMELSAGRVQLPLRTHIDLDHHNGTTLVMPAHVSGESAESLAVKVVSVFGGNPDRGLARIQAVVNVFDPQTGRPIAIIEGSSLTAIRTAAASGAATDVLAPPGARRLAILGAGVQARTHLQAMMTVREIEQVLVYAPNTEKVQALINELQDHQKIVAASTANEAVRDADIVCTVTTSKSPVFDDQSIRDGVHINAVGSYQPHVVEIPAATVVRSRVWVDHLSSAMDEAGDLIQPINSGLIGKDHVLGEVGQVLLQDAVGRKTDADITLFKSVGNAAEDAVAAACVVENARRLGLGTEVEF